MKQGKRNWFNIVITAWAITLVLVATTWFVAPAFAFGGGGGGDVDCTGVCADYCGNHDTDCDYAYYVSGYCDVFCDNGLSRSVLCTEV